MSHRPYISQLPMQLLKVAIAARYCPFPSSISCSDLVDHHLLQAIGRSDGVCCNNLGFQKALGQGPLTGTGPCKGATGSRQDAPVHTVAIQQKMLLWDISFVPSMSNLT